MAREMLSMQEVYDYKFVRVGEGVRSVKRGSGTRYQEVIQEYAEEGWRLVQVFAPATGHGGRPRYFDIILERKRSEH